ncbi:MAG: DUF1275 domain-containing protein [Rhodospirillales bacterium]|nr:DUF1275 domain-containing protein [Rhodospirillales bacterium]
MLIREGAARGPDHDRRLAAWLAAMAGALNAAVFHAVGFFAANMTGNVSSVSDRAALGQEGLAGFFAAIVTTFIAGAVASTLLINAARRRRIAGVYAVPILVESVLLAVLGIGDAMLDPPLHGTVLILGLAFLMGLQNATVTRISQARVRTTHISGMATDIGIEIAMLIDIARGRLDEVPGPWRDRLVLHAITVGAFLGGGVVGVAIYQAVGAALLGVVAAALFVLAMDGLMQARRLARAG